MVRSYGEDGAGLPAIVAEAENREYPGGGGITEARPIQHWLTAGLSGPDLNALEPVVIDGAKDSIDAWYDRNGHFDFIGKSTHEPTADFFGGRDGSYTGTVELGFRSATYPLRWLPALLNPYRRRAARQAQHDLRFQRTPEGLSGTNRLRLLSREDCWVNVRRGVAEAVFEFNFRVTAASERAVRRYLEWAFAPVPDRIEVTDIERMYPVRSGLTETETSHEDGR